MRSSHSISAMLCSVSIPPQYLLLRTVRSNGAARMSRMRDSPAAQQKSRGSIGGLGRPHHLGGSDTEDWKFGSDVLKFSKSRIFYLWAAVVVLSEPAVGTPSRWAHAGRRGLRRVQPLRGRRFKGLLFHQRHVPRMVTTTGSCMSELVSRSP